MNDRGCLIPALSAAKRRSSLEDNPCYLPRSGHRCSCQALLGASHRLLVRQPGTAGTASLVSLTAPGPVMASEAKVARCRRARRLLDGAALAGVRVVDWLETASRKPGSEAT